jgi:hypothetical protein
MGNSDFLTLDNLLRTQFYAEDTGDAYAYFQASEALDWYLTTTGNLSPATALLASILLDPACLPAVRAILPKPAAFPDSHDRALYTALLAIPRAAYPDSWSWQWALAEHLTQAQVYPDATTAFGVLLSLLSYEHCSCAWYATYAAAVARDAAQEVIVRLGPDLLSAAHAPDGAAHLTACIATLTAVRDKLAQLKE